MPRSKVGVVIDGNLFARRIEYSQDRVGAVVIPGAGQVNLLGLTFHQLDPDPVVVLLVLEYAVECSAGRQAVRRLRVGRCVCGLIFSYPGHGCSVFVMNIPTDTIIVRN